MVRPCVARGFRRSVGFAVLHQCIRLLIGAYAPSHHGYQRACVLITGQASTGPFGSPGFACAGKTGPPSLLILSQTSAGNRMWVLRHRWLLIGAVPLFVPWGRSFVPACGCHWAPRAGAVKAGRRAWLASGTGVSRPCLDGTEHGATLKRIGTPSYLSWRIRSCAPC